uniref:Uncharacterized protein n=1 Tax=Vitrella brassicaformis TaxID=1169539 RepID=A0A7S1KBV6_9ALVE|mmetsp:Transcript_47432/g.118488  ORF Transcript_47432/g.118488 Transcript_47432/m.118488 type:complete len:129 (+) Transcript_47432:314-700(+)
MSCGVHCVGSISLLLVGWLAGVRVGVLCSLAAVLVGERLTDSGDYPTDPFTHCRAITTQPPTHLPTTTHTHNHTHNHNHNHSPTTSIHPSIHPLPENDLHSCLAWFVSLSLSPLLGAGSYTVCVCVCV